MQAEERYGRGGFMCTPTISVTLTGAQRFICSDVGNGQYEPLYAGPGGQVPGYGATSGGNYVN